MIQAAFVACDIVGHSSVEDLSIQRARVADINRIVKDAIEREGPEHVFWASGGDGGHVLFCQDDWSGPAVDLIGELRGWAARSGVPLRVIGHRGAVDRTEGADGRAQFVGDGINLSGRILECGFPEGVIVSDRFGEELARGAGGVEVDLHDPRVVYLKHFRPQRIELLSIPGQFRSSWGDPLRDDRDVLSAASPGQRPGGWELLLHAKRLLQINTRDPHAVKALNELGIQSLVFCRSASRVEELNPLLGRLDKASRLELVRLAHLIERQPNEVICRRGDAGDSMFIVLDGEVAIILGEGPEGGPAGTPQFSARAGDIIGELAFALKRKRSATLLATRKTSLLSFNSDQFLSLTRSSTVGGVVKEEMNRFIRTRILEHVCNAAPFLVGGHRAGPLGDVDEPWELLASDSQVLDYPRRDNRLVSLENDDLRGDGLYVLVGGSLKSALLPDKELDDDALPVLYADLPGRVVSLDHRYTVERDATLLRIGAEALLQLEPEQYRRVVAEVKKALANLFRYDVFISYTVLDRALAIGWKDAMEAAGLKVFIDLTPIPLYFVERIAAAIVESLVLVPIISANTGTRPESENWVIKEVEFRKSTFEPDSSNVLPVLLPGGKIESIASGFSPITAAAPTAEAVQRIREVVDRIRGGEYPPPFSLRRKRIAKLG